jgi:flagellar hook assembly protein FlgD
VTTIRFDLPGRCPVRLSIYNAAGQLVRVLLDRETESGSREIIWDGRDSAGRTVGSGIYFYRLSAPAFNESRKMILLR